MKKHILIIIILIVMVFQLPAQKTKDVLYLKNGSMIYGKLIEVNADQYKIQTSDGSIFIYPSPDVEKFTREVPYFDGRKGEGVTIALEAGLLIGSQNSQYFAPFSFNFLVGIISNTKNSGGIGSGVEFIGRPYTPIFIEYKHLIYDRKTSPYIFARGGAILPLGVEESTSPNISNNNYDPVNFKGGASFSFGSGISWAKEDNETYLSFAYRYAHTSYEQKEYNVGKVTYNNSLNRLEIKFGFKF